MVDHDGPHGAADPRRIVIKELETIPVFKMKIREVHRLHVFAPGTMYSPDRWPDLS